MICEEIGASVLRRHHLALHILVHGLSVSHVKVCDVHHASLRCGHVLQVLCLDWQQKRVRSLL